MILDYHTMPTEDFPRFKEGEGLLRAQMHFDGMNRIMQGRLQPASSIGMHTHATNSEIVFILSGKGKMLYDDTVEELVPGVCSYCPKGHRHSLVNDGTEELVFFAVVPEQ